MSTVPIYVISNGDLFREALNAIVTVLGTTTFATALRIASLFAILSVGFYYTQTHDVAKLLFWTFLYFFVTMVLLGPKLSVEVIDVTNPGAVYEVDNVPYGLAKPASLITAVAEALTSEMDTAFHMPEDASYSKTGMLFGSHLFRESTGFHFISPQVQSDFDQYVKNCVAGDLLINQKYAKQDLETSTDIWGTMSQKPSPTRGVFLNGTFQTCQDATPLLKQAIDQDAAQGIQVFGLRFFGGTPDEATLEMNHYLPTAYQYYANVSQSASQIMTQAMLINGIRNGLLNYNADTDASGALLNLSDTMSMEKTRLSWATALAQVGYTLPLMQTVMLLFVLCLFPLVVLLSIQPVLGIPVFKNWLYTLLWLESWPLMYAILNVAVTFYLQRTTAGLAAGGLTLSNSNPLALEHSDVANLAGYLMTTVPFIAIGLVKGMASAFNTAANFIGGMMHSTALSAGSEVASGNVSLGNMSYDNVNANKFNTNFSTMDGMRTMQLSNGALVTQTADGSLVYDTTGAMSRLPTSVNASAMMNDYFSRACEQSRQSAEQYSLSYQNAVSDAANQLASLSHLSASQLAEGQGYSVGLTSSEQNAMNTIQSVAQDVAMRNHVTEHEALQALTQLSVGGDLHGGVGLGGAKGIASGDIGLKGNVGLKHDHSSQASVSHDLTTGLDITRHELDQFSGSLSTLQNYANTDHADSTHSQNDSLLKQVSYDYREAQTAAFHYSSSLTNSARYSDLAQYSQTHQAAINNHFDQAFANYVRRVEPERADILLTNTASVRVAEERAALAQRFMDTEFARQFQQGFTEDSGKLNLNQSSIDASQYYHPNTLNAFNGDMKKAYHTQETQLNGQGQANVGTDASIQYEYQELQHRVSAQNSAYTDTVSNEKKHLQSNDESAHDHAIRQIQQLGRKASDSAFQHEKVLNNNPDIASVDDIYKKPDDLEH